MPACKCANSMYLYCGDSCSLECPLWQYYYAVCYEKYYLTLQKDCQVEYDYYPCPVELITTTKRINSFYLCPSDRPFLCNDNTCVTLSGDCQVHSECLYSQVQCEDGTCAGSFDACGTVITCPKSRPVLCPDNTCKENEKDCTQLEPCPKESPFRCPDMSCVKNRYDCPLRMKCECCDVL